jgi:hypothetical protein
MVLSRASSGHGVHQLVGSLAGHAQPGGKHDQPDQEAAVMVGGAKADGVKQRQTHRNQRDGRRDDIGEIVPGICNHGSAQRLPAIAKLSGGESGLHHRGKQQRPDHKTCGCGTLRVDVQERTIGDERAGGGQHQADDEARQRLGAAVTIGMIGIGGKGGQGEAQQDEAGGENVGGGFQSVGHHGGGMAHDAGDNLDHGKRAADSHAGNGDSLPDLHSIPV